MDFAAVAMSQNLQMLQSAVSTSILQKAMGQDAQSVAAVLEMQPAPQLATSAGHMDIKV